MVRGFPYEHKRSLQYEPKQTPRATRACLHHFRKQQRKTQPWNVVNALMKRGFPLQRFSCQYGSERNAYVIFLPFFVQIYEDPEKSKLGETPVTERNGQRCLHALINTLFFRRNASDTYQLTSKALVLPTLRLSWVLQLKSGLYAFLHGDCYSMTTIKVTEMKKGVTRSAGENEAEKVYQRLNKPNQ